VTGVGQERLGVLLHRLRTGRGWSCQRLAEELNDCSGRHTLTRIEVWRYEREKRLLGRTWLPYYARVLGVAQEELERARAVSLRHRQALQRPEAQEPGEVLASLLPEPGPFTVASARGGRGRRLGERDADALFGRVHGLRLADDVMGGRDLIGPVSRELQRAVGLYRVSSHTTGVGRRLLTAIGELAQIAGWVASDAGAHQEAERMYRLGISAAKEAGDTVGEANLISCLAYQEANAGSPERAVVLARTAVHVAGHSAPPRARALLSDRLAWAQAQAGDASGAVRALGEADEALEGFDGMPDAGWLYWVSRDELEVMAARVFTELHRPLRAVPLLTGVLARYNTAHAREIALYASWLAIAYADAGEPEEAVAVAARMLALGTLGSARAAERTTAVAGALRRFATVPAVAELLDHIARGPHPSER
jgi:hypothetical protein